MDIGGNRARIKFGLRPRIERARIPVLMEPPFPRADRIEDLGLLPHRQARRTHGIQEGLGDDRGEFLHDFDRAGSRRVRGGSEFRAIEIPADYSHRIDRVLGNTFGDDHGFRAEADMFAAIGSAIIPVDDQGGFFDPPPPGFENIKKAEDIRHTLPVKGGNIHRRKGIIDRGRIIGTERKIGIHNEFEIDVGGGIGSGDENFLHEIEFEGMIILGDPIPTFRFGASFEAFERLGRIGFREDIIFFGRFGDGFGGTLGNAFHIIPDRAIPCCECCHDITSLIDILPSQWRTNHHDQYMHLYFLMSE